MGENYQPYPIPAGVHVRTKKFINGPNYSYIEAFAGGWNYTEYWVELELVIDKKSFGRSRIPYNYGEPVPIPRVLIPPFVQAELRVYLHNIATSELVQCMVYYSMVEVTQIEYAELLINPDSRAIYIE